MRLWPFATNTVIGLYCLDYRSDTPEPAVVFVDVSYEVDEKGAVNPVAPIYTAMLDKLRE